MKLSFKHVVGIALLPAICVGLAACSAIPLQPGAEKIMVSQTPAASTCKFLGMVTANQGNFFTGGYTSNANMQQGAFNDIRNKAMALGGNRVVLVMTDAASTGSGAVYQGTGGGSSQQTNVALTGNVYNCPNQ